MMQLVLDTHNISLRVRNRSFLVAAGKERRLISPQRLSSIAVISPCVLSSAAVLLAVSQKIPIIFFDHAGEPEAQVWSTRFGNMAELRRAQVLFGMSEEAPQWAAYIFRLKTQRQIENLAWAEALTEEAAKRKMLNSARVQMAALMPRLEAASAAEEPFSALMQIEAQLARLYWPQWGAVAPAGFRFSARSRRPATDMYNAALNYLYGMLYNVVEGATLAAGLDPMFGIIHADEFGAPTLVFDLIEPFRPCIDQLLHRLLEQSQLDARHFEPVENGIGVGREGRKLLIQAFNDYLRSPVLLDGQELSFKNHLYRQAGDLALRLKTFWENDPSGKLRHRRRPAAPQSGE